MEGTLRVAPEKLREASSQFASTDSLIRNITTEMISMVNGLKGAWEGDAADTYTSKFGKLQTDMEKIHLMIQEHVKDLETMAGEYTNAEMTNVEVGGSLADSVIS